VVEPIDHSAVAYSTLSTVRHGPRCLITSVLYRPLIVSASALSNESPTVPTEARIPASARRSRTGPRCTGRRCDGSPHPDGRPRGGHGSRSRARPHRAPVASSSRSRCGSPGSSGRTRRSRSPRTPSPTRSTHMSCRRPTADSVGVRVQQRCCLPVGMNLGWLPWGSMLTMFSVGADLPRRGVFSIGSGVAGCGIGHTRSVRSLSTRHA